MKNYPFSYPLYLLGVSMVVNPSCSPGSEDDSKEKPNIVIIYTDDQGIGDVSCYGATGLQTPNIDYLAHHGIRFTQGYATSATCTPSRYALLTGVYPWRNEDAQILPGDAPLLIDTAMLTMPKMLQYAGYTTGIVGKWHLGLGYGKVDWNKKVSPGPNEVGFDYSYIMASTNDRVPSVFLENGNVVGLEADDPLEISYSENFEGEPTGLENPEMLKMKWHHGHNQSIHNGIPRIGYMRGGKSALWIDENMADTVLVKAQQFVKENKNKPFFLFYALHQPHVPRTPHPRFVGMSGMGPRGDAIVEADWCIGEFIKTLKEEGLLENTLIVFSSDNGPVLNDGYYDDAVEKLGDHKPWGNLRGGKYSLFDAGTHLPFIVSWEGKIEPGVSDALVCQLDLMASFANLSGVELKGKDSQDLMDVFMGKSTTGRDDLVLEAFGNLAYRKGDWAMIPPYEGEPVNKLVNIELGKSDHYQLYNLSEDEGQQKNLADENPEKLEQMIEGLRSHVPEFDKQESEELELH